MYKEDANSAVDHGNDDPSLPQYEINFGGRRAFCDSVYADLGKIQLYDILYICIYLYIHKNFLISYSEIIIILLITYF